MDDFHETQKKFISIGDHFRSAFMAVTLMKKLANFILGSYKFIIRKTSDYSTNKRSVQVQDLSADMKY
jgi:hypothetical protein